MKTYNVKFVFETEVIAKNKEQAEEYAIEDFENNMPTLSDYELIINVKNE